ncbi:tRNA 2-selenouridine(34) synthase MnmH [Halanaerobium sp. MA284_MarDTE_T2]|uniref:tRNA 2-selenouridine(34) synthase MnmH n=1 Tax=Halanaerobium sp. MA284_MarDTE_T2 TaxID=2183913 RepID=UPI000E182486|nr:tRNA 2-selenouridine(34) synthase MnmH [Halanaerobium sp. MA284_MarDTE_T2]RCW48760.1 tRNA 2-selenouridine synthase [Halanaerobium sp. MA284_MarDTE_T2]
MKVIKYEDTLDLKNKIYIDVRTEEEFTEATIPSAVNIPLLNFEERKLIGTMYKQESPKKAKLKGVEIVAPKIPTLIKKINNLNEKYDNLILFCSRGGLRSESPARFAELAGIEVFKLKGGYKAYRNYILDRLDSFDIKNTFVTLHGNTGVGKTKILLELEKMGESILDLEALANHRGSAFGSIGLGSPYNQKMFDSLLYEDLKKKDKKGGYIFLEAESKRIGYSIIPDIVLQAMQAGPKILIKAPIEKRVEIIYEEYVNDIIENKDKFIHRAEESLKAIEKYVVQKAGKNVYSSMLEDLRRGDFKPLIKKLLQKYYDPLYAHSQNKIDQFAAEVESDNIRKAAEKILQLVNSTSFRNEHAQA